MFDGWSNEVFAAWLAGYFDGEGCVHIPKNGIGIDVSIASTTQEVIEAIHARTGHGLVEMVTFERKNWKTKFSWRLRRYSEAHAMLTLMRPYLTIKALKADEALSYLKAKLDKTTERHALYLEVARMIDSGIPRSDVAEALGIRRKTVDYMYRYRPVILDRARAGALPGTAAHYVDHGVKERIKVVTSTDRKRRRWNLMNEDTVRQIRARVDAGEHPVALAAEFNISHQTVRDIGNRRTWKNVG